METRYKHIKEQFNTTRGAYKLFLCHYPIPLFSGHYQDHIIHLYGHVHNTHEEEMTQLHLEEVHKYELGPTHMLNIGSMFPYMGYTPKTIDELWDIYTQLRASKNKLI